jgi:hypothetical protein
VEQGTEPEDQSLRGERGRDGAAGHKAGRVNSIAHRKSEIAIAPKMAELGKRVWGLRDADVMKER